MCPRTKRGRGKDNSSYKRNSVLLGNVQKAHREDAYKSHRSQISRRGYLSGGFRSECEFTPSQSRSSRPTANQNAPPRIPVFIPLDDAPIPREFLLEDSQEDDVSQRQRFGEFPIPLETYTEGDRTIPVVPPFPPPSFALGRQQRLPSHRSAGVPYAWEVSGWQPYEGFLPVLTSGKKRNPPLCDTSAFDAVITMFTHAMLVSKKFKIFLGCLPADKTKAYHEFFFTVLQNSSYRCLPITLQWRDSLVNFVMRAAWEDASIIMRQVMITLEMYPIRITQEEYVLLVDGVLDDRIQKQCRVPYLFIQLTGQIAKDAQNSVSPSSQSPLTVSALPMNSFPKTLVSSQTVSGILKGEPMTYYFRGFLGGRPVSPRGHVDYAITFDGSRFVLYDSEHSPVPVVLDSDANPEAYEQCDYILCYTV